MMQRGALALLLVACEAPADRVGDTGRVYALGTPEGLNAACEACHVEESRQWRASLHRAAFREPAFMRSFAREPKPFCQGCHAPHADPQRPPGLWAAENGVTCVTCHVESGTVRAAATARSSQAAPHPLARSAAFAGPQACAGCHEFEFPPARRRAPGAKMQQTLEEHARSDYAALACADCHMRPSGAGGRDHRFDVSRNPALLRAALSASARRVSPDALALELAPVGVGHALPTGDLFRRLALEVEARDADGERVAAATKYLARHFRPWVHTRERAPDPPEPDDRLTGAATFELQAPGARSGHSLRWRVTYQRVDQRDPYAPERSTLAGEVVLAEGELAAQGP